MHIDDSKVYILAYAAWNSKIRSHSNFQDYVSIVIGKYAYPMFIEKIEKYWDDYPYTIPWAQAYSEKCLGYSICPIEEFKIDMKGLSEHREEVYIDYHEFYDIPIFYVKK